MRVDPTVELLDGEYEAGLDDGAADEKEQIVKWLRTKAPKYADDIEGAMVFIATCIENDDHWNLAPSTPAGAQHPGSLGKENGMSDKRIYTSQHMDIAEALFTRGERTAIGWSDRADIAAALTAVANSGSDGYHTFAELYEHRHALFIALCRELNSWAEVTGAESLVWRSKSHADGSMFDGWFVMGIDSEPGKQIMYHLPDRLWGQTEFAPTLPHAPDWDGHKPDDVVKRLGELNVD